MKTYLFRVVVEPDDDRWVAYCPLLEDKGGATWGLTQEEAIDNIQDVIQMTVESMIAHGEPIPEAPPEEIDVLHKTRVTVTV